MTRKARGRVSVPHVLAVMALMISLGGTAYALSNNSVKSKHIKNGQVKSVDLKNNDVKGKDVNEASLDPSCRVDQVKAYVVVNGPALTSTYEDVGGYNCTGGSIMAKSTDTGEFEFDIDGFEFDSTTGSVVQITPVGGSGGAMTGYGTTGGNHLRVNTYDNIGGDVDKTFSLTIWQDDPVAP